MDFSASRTGSQIASSDFRFFYLFIFINSIQFVISKMDLKEQQINLTDSRGSNQVFLENSESCKNGIKAPGPTLAKKNNLETRLGQFAPAFFT
jgi:hypothetical protein